MGDGIAFGEAWAPIWVTGTLNATASETELASAGYTIADAQFHVRGSY